MPTLGVNIDHVATVRQARRTDEPDPVWAAVEAQLGGAHCITFHLREDRRHIIDRDVPLFKEVVACKLNMEMAAADEIVGIAVRTQPTQCTLVPEKREEITTEGGLDVVRHADRVGQAVRRLKDAGIIVSAFIEPEARQIEKSAELGFDAVELWTGAYAHATGEEPRRSHRATPAPPSGLSSPSTAGAETTREEALQVLAEAVQTGIRCGLEVHGGHGLTYRNVGPVVALPGFSEFNIGHSIIARAVFVGLRAAVREMKDLLERFAPKPH